MIRLLIACALVGTLLPKPAPDVSAEFSEITYPNENRVIGDTTPYITGIVMNDDMEPLTNEKVELFIDDISVATLKTNKQGIWSYQVTEKNALAEGVHTIRVIAQDTVIDEISFTIDQLAPNAPVINNPKKNQVFKNVEVTFSGTMNFKGGEFVELLIDDTDMTGPIFPDATGNWSITVTLAQGKHTVYARVVGESFIESELTKSISFTVK